jgi:hypothetical protein
LKKLLHKFLVPFAEHAKVIEVITDLVFRGDRQPATNDWRNLANLCPNLSVSFALVRNGSVQERRFQAVGRFVERDLY